jgi:5-methylcytosine-specific restriction endonuclease McrA
MSKRLCCNFGCRGLIADGVCSGCGPVHGWTHSTSASRRGYDKAWEALRAELIREASRQAAVAGELWPRCALCGNPMRGEIHADHIEPFNGPGDPRRLDPANVRLVHRRCHMARTRKQHA